MKVGRADPIGTSQRTVKLDQWTRCGTEGFLAPKAFGEEPRHLGLEPAARSQTRWVTEQNSETKQPRRGQAVLVTVEGSTEEETMRGAKASGRNFCLDRNLLWELSSVRLNSYAFFLSLCSVSVVERDGRFAFAPGPRPQAAAPPPTANSSSTTKDL